MLIELVWNIWDSGQDINDDLWAAEFGNAVSGIGKILKVCPEEEKIMIPLLLNIDGHIFFSRGSL